MGNPKEALRLIVSKLHDVDQVSVSNAFYIQ